MTEPLKAEHASHTFFDEDFVRQPSSDNRLIPTDLTKVVRFDIVNTIMTTLETRTLKIYQVFEMSLPNTQILICHIFAIPITMNAVKTDTNVTSMTSYQPFGYRTIGPVRIVPVAETATYIKGHDELGQFDLTFRLITSPSTQSSSNTPFDIVAPTVNTVNMEITRLTSPESAQQRIYSGPAGANHSIHISRISDPTEPMPQRQNYLDNKFYRQFSFDRDYDENTVPHDFGTIEDLLLDVAPEVSTSPEPQPPTVASHEQHATVKTLPAEAMSRPSTALPGSWTPDTEVIPQKLPLAALLTPPLSPVRNKIADIKATSLHTSDETVTRQEAEVTHITPAISMTIDHPADVTNSDIDHISQSTTSSPPPYNHVATVPPAPTHMEPAQRGRPPTAMDPWSDQGAEDLDA